MALAINTTLVPTIMNNEAIADFMVKYGAEIATVTFLVGVITGFILIFVLLIIRELVISCRQSRDLTLSRNTPRGI